MKKNYILITIAVILAVSSVLVTIGSASSGVEASKIEQEKTRLLSQKRDLETSLVTSLSMGELETKSGELGFVKPQDPLYLGGIDMFANAVKN